ncbi:DUF4386 domain-containing protein [Paenibacillus lautus]|uniref:DUF4386 domain-containing protein n=1 Tax=Paenibacillus lautus TaxID=1401 RepID=UPI001C11DDB7|nr:DUF4386 domain-containing protein [Paenibacillus lautus]MBU5348480.1 DUF4386 domain-containing protein [Paenibacillus lautus]
MLRKSTNSGRRSAVITGVLLIFGLVTGIFSVVPVIDGVDYLVKASTNENELLTGAFFQLLMVVAYVGVPIIMYPILSKHNKGLALGSVAFGIIAGVFIIIGVIILLLLLTLSHEFAKVGTLDVSSFQTLGVLLREGRDLVNHVALSILASLLFMIRFIGLDATYMMLNFPIAFHQLVLAIWLIIKGFNLNTLLDKITN